MGSGTKCMKYTLVVVNALFFLAGAAVLGIGLWVRFDKSVQNYVKAEGMDVITKELYLASYILIGFGGFTFIVGFCGCCGAMKENKGLMGVYILLVLIILGAEIGGGIYVYLNKDKLIKNMEKVATEFIKDKYAGSNSTSDKGWDTVMEQVECCGVNGVSDFNNSLFRNSFTRSVVVPRSCCTRKDKSYVDEALCQLDARNGVSTSDYLNVKGCTEKLEELIADNSWLLLWVGIGVAAFELIVLFIAIGYCCKIGKD